MGVSTPDDPVAKAKEFLKEHPPEPLPATPVAAPKPDFMEWATTWAQGVLCNKFNYACEAKPAPAPVTAAPAAPETKPPELTNSRAHQQMVMDESGMALQAKKRPGGPEF